MKIHILLAFMLFMAGLNVLRSGEPFRGRFVAQDVDIKMVLDLYSESVDVPGLEMFGPLNGYLKGKDLYCTWYVSTIKKCDAQKAFVHFSNDLGSETQSVELTWEEDSILTMREVDGAVLKKVVGKKLVKLPTTFKFKREKD